MRPNISHKPLWLALAAALCAAGMWTYVNRVLIPYQISDAATRGRPRGNLSDLYPRWVGAKELLLHGRDPYSAEVTCEIQAGYYGRPLDPSRPNDPRDRAGVRLSSLCGFFPRPNDWIAFRNRPESLLLDTGCSHRRQHTALAPSLALLCAALDPNQPACADVGQSGRGARAKAPTDEPFSRRPDGHRDRASRN